MFYSWKNKCHITPQPPHTGYLSLKTVTLLCHQGGRCRKVGRGSTVLDNLLNYFLNKQSHNYRKFILSYRLLK